MSANAVPEASDYGPNEWLVEEMHERFSRDPASVPPGWAALFATAPVATAPVATAPVATAPGSSTGNGVGAGGPRSNGARTAPATDRSVPVAPASTPAGAAQASPPAGAIPASTPAGGAQASTETPLRGAAARLASNMAASLAVPTATSVRDVPARLLEVNREVINNHLARTRGGKVSFTHLIGFAVVRALVAHPAMRSSFVPSRDGAPDSVARHEGVGLGIAIDLPKAGGARTLLVPCVRGADELAFAEFRAAYEDVVARARDGRLTPSDFEGTTATLTNPGTLGTTHSVPRLMPGQGVIVGVGSLAYPASFQASDPQVLADLGVSKVMTVTSTYDHRVIQGAESGAFLQHLSELLLGGHGFYDDVFASMSVPYVPIRWQRDSNAQLGEQARLEKQTCVQRLINMYRVRGHLIADLDPLSSKPPRMHPELDPDTYGLTVWDLEREFLAGSLAGGRRTRTLGEILGVLRDAYCRTVGVEYMHIQEPDQKRWVQEHVEGVPARLDPAEQRHVLGMLNAAEAFERFLHTRYVGQKRFGLEGAESAIPLIDAILDEAATSGVTESVMGMAHRGRLNVLANIVGKSYEEIFREFEGDIDPESVQGSGDVKYHKGASGKFVGLSDRPIPVTLASNPSHLEAVDPVVEGMVRARQDVISQGDPNPVLALLVHGDAAFAGQGVVAETLNLSGLAGYHTGGTVHVVINNQLGFTTAPEYARSSIYATDVAKMVQAPIFHVNGDDPEACARVGRMAMAFRQAFRKDVVIDMVCYRRYGHNEGDEPSFTQPQMYETIEQHRSVRELYTMALVARGDISEEDARSAMADFSSRLQSALDQTRLSSPPKPTSLPAPHVPAEQTAVATGVAQELLDGVARALHTAPNGFTVHPKLGRQIAQRSSLYGSGRVDWSLAEALAFGTLLAEGTDVRLAGQDTRRGTFSQRHAVWVDYHTGAEHTPLASFGESIAAQRSGGDQPGGRFLAYDSLLSEYAALGFEYGYSVLRHDALVAWEAQFGDFSNAAQIVVDQFIVAAEDKWGQASGLVLLLPHGYEGQGPEHSSARMERFLTLSAGGNITVVNPTTAAQYFHVLRRQLKMASPKPLVVFTPKSLLRSKASQSPVGELVGGVFSEVLDDPGQGPHSSVRRVLLTSGKIAYEAMSRRAKLWPGGDSGCAVLRVEQLYPWPERALSALLGRYPVGTEVVWLQEEPENMGAWSFVHGRLHRIARERLELRHVSRAESASPGTGSAAMHQLEAEDLLERAFAFD
ncbi:MAG: multifunctional oxoglutarate decarboxylase/oxoglutarate dehydrogenase thiamine pyrophosphate-binding subunit/dihydrolipoyllysine-residue succinyltransferase subunit [Acidimicrobiales bacterium]